MRKVSDSTGQWLIYFDCCLSVGILFIGTISELEHQEKVGF